jgi:hypothetical protein
MSQTKAAAEAQMIAIYEGASVAQLVQIGRKCLELSTPISAWNLRLIMTVLANRFDRRSFINICEEITA